MNTMKNSLLVCSGGIDSTAVLIEYFDRCYNDVSMDFDILYIKIRNNYYQNRRELKALNKMVARLSSDYRMPRKNIVDYYVMYMDDTKNVNTAFSQQLTYAIGAASFKGMENYREVVYGYIKDDDYWHIKSEAESVFRSILKMKQTNGCPEFRYPLEWCTKKDVVKTYENFKHILSMTHVCEDVFGCSEDSLCKKCEEKNNAIVN